MNDIDKNGIVEEPHQSSFQTSFLIRIVAIIFVIVCIIFFVCWVAYIVLVGYMEPMAMFIPRSGPLISTELDEQIRLQTKSIPNGYMFSLYPTYTVHTPRRALVVFHGNGGCAMQSILSFVRLLYVGKNETIQLNDRERSDPMDIVVYEYPGFGHRFGQKIKKQKEFLQEAVSFFRSVLIQRIMLVPEALYWEYQYKSISVIGTSLGTGVATHVLAHLDTIRMDEHHREQQELDLSTKENDAKVFRPRTGNLAPHETRIQKLILITPYSSMRDTIDHQTGGLLGWISSWKMLDNVKNLNNMKRRHACEGVQKVLVFAEDDQLLPVDKHAYKFTPYANQTYVLTKTDHNGWPNRYFLSFWRNMIFT